MPPTIRHTVLHDLIEQRFYCNIQGHLNVADYHLNQGVMRMTHTQVHTSLQGQGIAAELVRAALAYAKLHGLKVNPQCSYVMAYMQRHPETQTLLT